MKKRDTSVELIRIIGCIIVVGVHICLPQIVDERPDIGRTYISCLLADGVAIFWMITGFFLFNNNSYKKLWIRTIKHIGIPALILTIFVFYFGEWILTGGTLAESVQHSFADYKNVIKAILVWTNPVEGLGHLWYVYVYLMIIAVFPVLKSFVHYLEQDTRREKIFLLVTFLFLLVNDVRSNNLAAFSHHSINGLVPACIEVIWGHILYKYRNVFKRRIYLIYCMAFFVAANILRTMVQMNRYEINISDKSILYWYTSIGILCATSIVIFGLTSDWSGHRRISRFICGLASYTYPIYLLHPIIKGGLLKAGVLQKMEETVLWNQSFFCEILYTIIALLLVFLLTLAVTIILRALKNTAYRAGGIIRGCFR